MKEHDCSAQTLYSLNEPFSSVVLRCSGGALEVEDFFNATVLIDPLTSGNLSPSTNLCLIFSIFLLVSNCDIVSDYHQ